MNLCMMPNDERSHAGPLTIPNASLTLDRRWLTRLVGPRVRHRTHASILPEPALPVACRSKCQAEDNLGAAAGSNSQPSTPALRPRGTTGQRACHSCLGASSERSAMRRCVMESAPTPQRGRSHDCRPCPTERTSRTQEAAEQARQSRKGALGRCLAIREGAHRSAQPYV